jgi:hypothetical protein
MADTIIQREGVVVLNDGEDHGWIIGNDGRFSYQAKVAAGGSGGVHKVTPF